MFGYHIKMSIKPLSPEPIYLDNCDLLHHLDIEMSEIHIQCTTTGLKIRRKKTFHSKALSFATSTAIYANINLCLYNAAIYVLNKNQICNLVIWSLYYNHKGPTFTIRSNLQLLIIHIFQNWFSQTCCQAGHITI